METVVNVTSHRHDLKSVFTIDESDFQCCERTWDEPNEDLIKYFKNMPHKYDKWSDIHPTHMKVMIIHLLDEAVPDFTEDYFLKLKFFICVHCLKMSQITGDRVDYIKINYLEKTKANFETFFDNTIAVDFYEVTKPKLQVVVDNSKTEK